MASIVDVPSLNLHSSHFLFSYNYGLIFCNSKIFIDNRVFERETIGKSEEKRNKRTDCIEEKHLWWQWNEGEYIGYWYWTCEEMGVNRF